MKIQNDDTGGDQKKTVNRINPKLLLSVQIILAVIAIFLLVSHIINWSRVQVDSITLGLVGVLLVIPFLGLISKIKLGEFEAEIGKNEVAKVQVKASTELQPYAEGELDTLEKEVRELLRSDPRLAMAKIRIELEEALMRLLAMSEPEYDLRKVSLGRSVDVLVQKEVLTKPIASSIRDVITLANRAVHGERVELSTAEELAILGVRLVHEIQHTYLERVLKPLERNVITTEEVMQHSAKQYKVTTIVPLVENPIKNVYIFDQEALEAFLEGYEEYAEFIVGVEPI